MIDTRYQLPAASGQGFGTKRFYVKTKVRITWYPAAGSWQLAAGSWQLAAGAWCLVHLAAGTC